MTIVLWSEQPGQVFETENAQQALAIVDTRKATQVARASLALISKRRQPTAEELNWWLASEVSLLRASQGATARPESDCERLGLEEVRG